MERVCVYALTGACKNPNCPFVHDECPRFWKHSMCIHQDKCTFKSCSFAHCAYVIELIKKTCKCTPTTPCTLSREVMRQIIEMESQHAFRIELGVYSPTAQAVLPPSHQEELESILSERAEWIKDKSQILHRLSSLPPEREYTRTSLEKRISLFDKMILDLDEQVKLLSASNTEATPAKCRCASYKLTQGQLKKCQERNKEAHSKKSPAYRSPPPAYRSPPPWYQPPMPPTDPGILEIKFGGRVVHFQQVQPL